MTETHSCGYVLDVQDPETLPGSGDRTFVDDRHLEGGTWQCSLEPPQDQERCIFHQPVEEKDDAEVVDAFLEEVRATDRDRSTFRCFGAKFGDFELPDTSIAGRRIELAHARIDGVCNLSGASIEVPYLDLAGLSVTGTANMQAATVDAYTLFVGASFQDGATWDGAEFGSTVDFRFATFGGPTSFQSVQFGNKSVFISSTFSDIADFQGATFPGEVTFNRASFRSALDFEGARFGDEAEFVSMQISGEANFDDVTFEEDPDFSFTEIGDVDRSGIR